jgi:hypothetical protein
MRSSAKRLALAAFIGCVIVAFNLHRADAQRRTPVTVTRLYTGPDGQTHSETVDIKLMPPSNGGEQSGPLMATGMQFRRFPPGWVNERHTAPQRLYVITLSGRSEVEDGRWEKIRKQPWSSCLRR